jgi:MerR family mercuric resistance operon transcriptional regulator
MEAMMRLQGLTAGNLAKAAKVNVETLRYYERRGLLPEPPRIESGYRVYPEASVDRLRFIKGAQVLGFTLEEIHELLNLRVNDHASRADVRKRAQEKVEHIEHKITALQAMRAALSDLIEQCHGDGPTSDCPILEAMPHAGLPWEVEPSRRQGDGNDY